MAATTRTPTLLLTLLLLTVGGASTSLDTFVYGGCSRLKFSPGSPYESTLNSLLTLLVNSASFTLYNNFTSAAVPVLYGLYQCRGDLSAAACRTCVAGAIARLAALCPPDAAGGAVQLDGCYVRYDNVSFLGVQDKTVVLKKCGASSVGYDSGASARKDTVLDYVVAGGGKAYRVGGSGGGVYAVAQCVQDLSVGQCQDCMTAAVGVLKSDCGAAAAWGDAFLGKCYARFSEGGAHSRHGNNDDDKDDNNDVEIEKTLAILIGLIAGVALLIVFLSFLRQLCQKGKGGK
ncbi:unnamed protein product [Linum tenue]|uniref:Gnk2-homologous domain-containing protein n=1 Tax=Linum tenue TaxID=586396 RepID=A0AAV0MWX4_9ROSI|nr:unnamed protein product [Linum tenue]